VAISPDGKVVASGGDDNTVRLWDAHTGQSRLTLPGHAGRVSSVAFSPDGKTIWSRELGRTERDGKMIFSRDLGRTVRAWDSRTGKPHTPRTDPPLFSDSGAWHPRRLLLALPQGANILLVDTTPPPEEEIAFRQAMARFDPLWHRRQAQVAQQTGEVFTENFHRGILVENNPSNYLAWQDLLQACARNKESHLPLQLCDRLLAGNSSLAPLLLRRAGLRQRAGDAPGAILDLARCFALVLQEPGGWDHFAEQGAAAAQETAEKRNWRAAAARFGQAVLWQPGDPWKWHQLAWIRLAAGDESGYRTTCQLMNSRFGTVEEKGALLMLSASLAQGQMPLAPGHLIGAWAMEWEAASRAEAIASTATLLPNGGVPATDLLPLAQRLLRTDPGSWSYQETAGAVLHRAGRHHEAIKHLEQAVRLRGGQEKATHRQKLFLALSWSALGEKKQARQWLDAAKSNPNDGWRDRLIFQRLGAEAAERLELLPMPARESR
jgi:tetratricopeptide (TPR) repeat protein